MKVTSTVRVGAPPDEAWRVEGQRRLCETADGGPDSRADHLLNRDTLDLLAGLLEEAPDPALRSSP